jgi:hypothetical protein
MMKRYYFYNRSDEKQEKISSTCASGRLEAAKYFSNVKCLSLKTFLKVFAVSN